MSSSNYCAKHDRPFSGECGDCAQEWLDALPREEQAVIYLRMTKWNPSRARRFVDEFRSMALMETLPVRKENSSG